MSSKKKSLKIAFVASVYGHFVAHHLPFIKLLQEEDYEVHAYANVDYRGNQIEDKNIICHDIPFNRSPYHYENVKSLNMLIKSFRSEQFQMVHVHTPVAGILGRMAARMCSIPCVMYTAHGFHFYSGASLKNWILYYPIEKWMARWTDHLITINQEDYQQAQKFRVKEKVHYIPGVGVNTKDIQKWKDRQIQQSIREQLKINNNDVVITCIAELNSNKNQVQLIYALHRIIESGVTNIKCLLVGYGRKEWFLRHKVQELGLQGNIFFLGYRRDVPEILFASDIIALLSYREGLPKALLEGLSAGKPIITTDVRGNRDSVEPGVNGFTVPINDVASTAKRIMDLVQNKQMRLKMGQKSLERSKLFDINIVLDQMKQIYQEALEKSRAR